ncbi:MAG: ZIP family metal transporter [Candidatus Pacebacteria bacterium]|nr:ZIP family metal transporter [Candidatus Paceibacterota bacterium]
MILNMPVLGYIILFSLIISSGALIGIFSLAAKKEMLEKTLLFLVSISAGTLMGGAFLHLIPEAAENLPIDKVLILVLFSFVIFYLIEKTLHWRHCHKGECKVHTFGNMSLIGDSIHNFIDGLIIAATFVTDINLGIATSIAIALHEIPQEIGDFGVLLYAGYKKGRALALNFLVALTVAAGGLAGYFLSFHVLKITDYLLPFAAGGFLYISTSDLIPEIRKESNLRKSIISFGFFLLGLAIMYFAKIFI